MPWVEGMLFPPRYLREKPDGPEPDNDTLGCSTAAATARAVSEAMLAGTPALSDADAIKLYDELTWPDAEAHPDDELF